MTDSYNIEIIRSNSEKYEYNYDDLRPMDHIGRKGVNQELLPPAYFFKGERGDLFMRIKHKLVFAISMILAFFTLLLFFTLYQWYNTVRLQNFRSESYHLIGDYNHMMHSAKSMTVSEIDLSVLINLWEKSVEELDNGLEEYFSSPVQDKLTPSLKKKVSSAHESWDQTKKDIEVAKDSLSNLKKNANFDLISEFGLIHGYYTLKDNPESYADLLIKINTVNRNLSTIELSATRFYNTLKNISEGVNKQVQQEIYSIFTVLAVLVVFVILMAILTTIIFIRSFTRRVKFLQKNMETLSELDLTAKAEIKGNDEITHLLKLQKYSVEQIGQFIASVHESVQQANNLKDTLSSGTNESVAALNEISMNIEEINKQINMLNDNITKSTSAVCEMDKKIIDITERIDNQTKAVNGIVQLIEDMDNSIKSVASLSGNRREMAQKLIEYVEEGGMKVDRTNSIINEISNEVKQMLDIIELINNISEQTDILSINAAIESANAGEAGKGFSVVAEEIRKLAESTTEKVQVIGDTLHRVTNNIEMASVASNESADSFEIINKDVNSFVSTLDEIQENIGELSDGSQNVLSSTNKVSELSNSLNSDSKYMKENADSIENAMKNLENISTEIVNGFKEINVGTKEVLNNFNDISQVSKNNSSQINHLYSLLHKFKIEEEIN